MKQGKKKKKKKKPRQELFQKGSQVQYFPLFGFCFFKLQTLVGQSVVIEGPKKPLYTLMRRAHSALYDTHLKTDRNHT